MGLYEAHEKSPLTADILNLYGVCISAVLKEEIFQNDVLFEG